MNRSQKLILVLSCLLYAGVIFGYFSLDPVYLLVLFVLFTIAVTAFAFAALRSHNDYTGAEHLQQEIGLLKAENEQIRADNERALENKDSEIRKKEVEMDDLKSRLNASEAALEAVQKESDERIAGAAQAAAAGQTEASLESLLPPDDEDPAVTVDIIDVARHAIAELSEAARAAGLTINISSASEKLIVHASAKRLLIMFRNIIDNSIKYMQTAGVLVITISAIEDDIFIVLKDTGRGLPENETRHIFELNYQGSNRISGNGLGLTQAKAIVEHYGGTIYARSPQGSGMGIYIQLPTS